MRKRRALSRCPLSVDVVARLEVIDDPPHAGGVIGKSRVEVGVARRDMIEQPRADLLGLVQDRSETSGDDHADACARGAATDTSASRSRRSSDRRHTSRHPRRTASRAAIGVADDRVLPEIAQVLQRASPDPRTAEPARRAACSGPCRVDRAARTRYRVSSCSSQLAPMIGIRDLESRASLEPDDRRALRIARMLRRDDLTRMHADLRTRRLIPVDRHARSDAR